MPANYIILITVPGCMSSCYARGQRFQFILTLEWWMGQEENSGKRKADLGIRALSVG